MGEEYVSLLFLVVIIIVVSSIVYRISAQSVGMTLIVSGLLLMFVAKSDESGCDCASVQKSTTPTPNSAHQNYTSADVHPASLKPQPAQHAQHAQHAQKYVSQSPSQNAAFPPPKVQPPPMVSYNEMISALGQINNMYSEDVCPGDTALTTRACQNGRRAKESIDNRARFDKYSALHYFDEELRSAANSRWWDDDSLEHKF